MSILKKEKGFTLIELLVVVAIVGILASITLGYLGSARKKGDDTAVKSNLATMRSVGELFFLDNNNSYLPAGGSTFNIATCPIYDAAGTNMLSKDKVIASSIAEAIFRGKDSACYNSDSVWAVAVGLKLVPDTSWCVDVTGIAKMVNSVPASAINSSTFLCN
ncbi:MAG: type II secretion system protein [bacterium]